MTIRRYYDDSYRWQFDANIVDAGSDGTMHFAVLDASHFYPTSGGQPHDTGTLGAARVLDVNVRAADGAIVHTLDSSLAEGPAVGVIDGVRRFDHMQQHTGQHILSQAFIRVANATTIGFHLGDETVSIDLNDASLSESAIAAAADATNQLISANVPVRAWFPSAEELEAIALRKVPDVEGALRVVAIGDFDYSACGGTHVARSGEVGLLSVVRVERMKRGTRIEFLAGHRARDDYARKHATVRALSAALTCAPAEIVDAVARLSATVTESRRALAAYKERDLDEEAQHLRAEGSTHGDLHIVRRAFVDRPIDEVKGLALRLTDKPGVVTLFALGGSRTQLIFARAQGVTAEIKPSFDHALAALGGGKGGGGRVLMGAAGAADMATVDAVLLDAESLLRV
ncbi:MAG: alanyl-tRNA editing protein [bacterium]